MLHIYRVYKFVRFIDKENNKLGQEAIAAFQSDTFDNSKFEMIHENDAQILFAEKRVWFKKVGVMRGAQTPVSADKKGYITREPSRAREGSYALRVEQDKGLALIDGFLFFRPGLWKAWYDAHGWMLTILPGSIIISAIGYGVKTVLK
jgi:hypothetical protein